MPVIGNSRKHYSELVKQTSKIEYEGAGNYHYARVSVGTIGGGADVDVDPVGTPVIWDDAQGLFVEYDGSITVATAAGQTSSLPDGSPVAFIVGPKEGKGLNEEDLTLTVAGTEATVIFRGEAICANKGITWNAGADAAEQAAFLLQIEKQGIAMIANSDVVDPTFVS